MANHIDPNALPRRSGNLGADLAAMFEFQWKLLAELRYQAEETERRLRELETRKEKETGGQ